MEARAAEESAHGDYAANIALVTAGAARMPPRKVAEILLKHLTAWRE